MSRYACIPMPSRPATQVPAIAAQAAGAGGQIILDPWLYPPADAEFWDQHVSADVAPGTTETLIEFQTDPGEYGTILAIGMEILDNPPGAALTGFSSCIWSLRLNGEPHPYYGDIRDQIGLGYQPTDILVKLKSDRLTVSFEVTNNHATDTFKCFGRLRGFFFRR